MNKNNTSKGLGFCDVLLVVFIVLKLIGVIAWSWFWVLSPHLDWRPDCFSLQYPIEAS